jgi:predicted ribosomally synthesized peptide with SipW-like signal peptide
MKKIGLFVLAIVLAIGALGVGYAAWTDTIHINGTVNTGDLDINAEYFSGTEVWKDVDADTAFERFWVEDADGVVMWESMARPTDFEKYLLVASAYAKYAGDDEVDIVFDNAFPYDDLTADVIIHCVGTVPVIVDADIATEDPMLAWLWDNGYVDVKARWVTITPDSWSISFGEEINGPVQMHDCEYVKLWLSLDLPQEEELDGTGFTAADFMDKDWAFTGHFYAIQWNEYESEWWITP